MTTGRTIPAGRPTPAPDASSRGWGRASAAPAVLVPVVAVVALVVLGVRSGSLALLVDGGWLLLDVLALLRVAAHVEGHVPRLLDGPRVGAVLVRLHGSALVLLGAGFLLAGVVLLHTPELMLARLQVSTALVGLVAAVVVHQLLRNHSALGQVRRAAVRQALLGATVFAATAAAGAAVLVTGDPRADAAVALALAGLMFGQGALVLRVADAPPRRTVGGVDQAGVGTVLACVVGRAAGGASRLAGRGAGLTLPGVVALRLRPDLLAELCHDRDVLLVSGTNGKTTTTGLLAAALAVRGPVVSNDSGSNLKAGLVTALLLAPAGRTAVLEVDEVVLPVALRSCRPSVVLLLNLSRDQLDRSSEVSMHMRKWTAALADSDAHIVANADDPLVVQVVRQARPDATGVSWVAAGQPWRADSAICPSCSAVWDVEVTPWSCPGCPAARPEVSWALVGRRLQHGSLDLPLDLALPGRAAAADAVLAAAAAAAGRKPVRVEDSVAAMAALQDVGGRYRVVRRGRHEVRLMLVKNPAGWVEALEEVRGRQTPVLLCFNARPADGTDPSWLWDVPFEQLAGVPVLVTGERATDVAVRLLYAEVAHTVHPTLSAALDALPDGAATLVANYTAFVSATALLAGARP